MPTAGGIYYWASQAGRPQLGLVHRLVQPGRPGRRGGLGRLRLRLVPVLHDRPVRHQLRRVQPQVHLPDLPRASWPCTCCSTCSRRTSCRYWNNTSAYWHVVGAAIIVLILIFGPDIPPERLVRVHALDQQLRLLRRHQQPQVLPLRGAAGRDPDAVHDHRLRRLRPPLRGDHGRGQGGRPGHVAVGVLLGDRRLDPAAVLPVRGQERRRDLDQPTPTAPARRSASSRRRWAWPGSRP